MASNDQAERAGWPLSDDSAVRPPHLRNTSSDSQPYLSQVSLHSLNSATAPLHASSVFSVKGHSRYPSSSSLASSPPVRASMDSYISKRPLEQLAEDPTEHDTGLAKVTSYDSVTDDFEEFPSIASYDRPASRDEPPIDYDWAENLLFEGSDAAISVAKRRRADKATSSVFSEKLASRFPGIHRRFKSRSDARVSSCADGMSLHEAFTSRSRASSMRSAATRESTLELSEHFDIPPLPASHSNLIEEEPLAEDDAVDGGHIHQRNQSSVQTDGFEDPEEHPGLSRTPLLPPLLSVRCEEEAPIQSPLQSPKVAGTPTASPSSPFEQPKTTPKLPSPPLSTQPSVSSFRHTSLHHSQQLPPIALDEPDIPTDEWTVRLGHENFLIKPEPYMPSDSTFDSCRQLKADWEQAEREFGRHLARTRANYSATSKIAQLTEEKWSAINAVWMKNHSEVFAAAVKAAAAASATAAAVVPGSHTRGFSSYDNIAAARSMALSRQPSLHEPVPKAQIPSHLVGGKFPNFGDAGIVGPMEVVKPISSAMGGGPRNRKRGFWRFLQDLIPTSLAGKA